MIIYELVTFDPSLKASIAKGLGKFQIPCMQGTARTHPSTARPTPSGRGRLWEESRRDV